MAAALAHGPRKQQQITGRVTQEVFEILRAAFQIQHDGEMYRRSDAYVDQETAGEVFEGYAMDTCPLLFGLTYTEYVELRRAGKNVDLVARYKRQLLEAL